MPLFEFRCSQCASDFEILVRSTAERAVCPQCGTDRLEKLLSEAAASAGRSLPITSACPPGDAPCSPTCCRL